jgi:tetratricopeptide (TPR) repeat protein
MKPVCEVVFILVCAWILDVRTAAFRPTSLRSRSWGESAFRLFSTSAPSRLSAQGGGSAPRPGNTPANDGKRKSKPARFIHPQVFKMFQRAQYLMRNGDNAVAQKLLVRCLELNPFDSHSWLALARLEAKLGNYERAREIFAQSLAKCPNNVHLLHAWGHLEQVCLLSCEVDFPANPRAWLNHSPINHLS